MNTVTVALGTLIGVFALVPLEAGELDLTAEIWPPYVAEETHSGYAIELVEKVLERAGYDSGLTLIGPGEQDEAIKEKKFEGIMAAWKTPAREEIMYYSKPYLENRLVLVTREGNPVDMDSFASLAGKRIAVVRNYGYEEELKRIEGPEFVYGKSNQDNLTALLRGEVDYALMDDLVIHHTMEFHGNKANLLLEVGSHAMILKDLCLTMRKDIPNAEKVIRDFNAQISSMLQDGTYHKILGVDWIRADTDDDGTPELISAGTQVGSTPPAYAYDMSPLKPAAYTKMQVRVIGEDDLYKDWNEVPDQYKLPYNPGESGKLRGATILSLDY